MSKWLTLKPEDEGWNWCQLTREGDVLTVGVKGDIKCVIFTGNGEARKAHSQNQEGDGHSLRMGEAHNQEKGCLHPKPWRRNNTNTEMCHVFHLIAKHTSTSLPFLSLHEMLWTAQQPKVSPGPSLLCRKWYVHCMRLYFTLLLISLCSSKIADTDRGSAPALQWVIAPFMQQMSHHGSTNTVVTPIISRWPSTQFSKLWRWAADYIQKSHISYLYTI